MTYDYDLVVIGAGSGGLTAAIGGAGIGAKTLLVEKNKLGGDCTHWGCVPSKTLIKRAKLMHDACEAYDKKPTPEDLSQALEAVQKTVADVEARFEAVETIEASGVTVKMGAATFVNRHTIDVDGEKITSKKFVIATGAEPMTLPIPGLSELNPKTNRTIFEPTKMTSLTVIGSGPIGCELAQAFARFGVAVTIITLDSRMLMRDDEDVSAVIEKNFAEKNVSVRSV